MSAKAETYELKGSPIARNNKTTYGDNVPNFINPFEIRYMLDGALRSVFATENEMMKAYVILSRRGAYNLIMRNRNTNEEIQPNATAKALA